MITLAASEWHRGSGETPGRVVLRMAGEYVKAGESRSAFVVHDQSILEDGSVSYGNGVYRNSIGAALDIFLERRKYHEMNPASAISLMGIVEWLTKGVNCGKV